MDPVGNFQLWMAILTAATAVGGPLNAPTLCLTTFAGIITPSTPLASLTEPTFTGYARAVGLVLGPPYIDAGGRVRVDAPSHTFICSGGVPIDTVTGWYLTDAGVTILLCAASLNTPVPIARIGDGVRVDPTFPYGA